MAIHSGLNSMAREAIPEYLHIARLSMETPKPEGGVYGFPAILLLFTVVDAVSNYKGYRKHSFGALAEILPDLKLTPKQIQSLAHWYRDPASHQGVLAPGVAISVADAGPAVEFNPEGEPIHIRLRPFFDAVRAAWEAMDHSAIAPDVHPLAAPKSRPTTIKVSVPFAASGIGPETKK